MRHHCFALGKHTSHYPAVEAEQPDAVPQAQRARVFVAWGDYMPP
jgi:hypothetical protein